MMKTLLVPVDFSDTTSHVLKKAAELAEAVSGRLVLVHVTEPVASYVPVGGSMDVITSVPPPLEQELPQVQTERLDALAKPLTAKGIAVDCVSIVGLAVDDILNQAESHKADYIILGSHGHGALYHLFSGSVVNGVLKRATCPVLVVPGEKKHHH